MPLIACGLVVTVFGVGGWTLVDRVRHQAQARQAGDRGHGGHQPGHGGLAAQAPGPVGRISGSSRLAGSGKVAKPGWLLIPAIGVSTTLVRLGITAQGTLQVPATAAVAGWYRGSPRPGQVGSSIIAGHIDSRLGAVSSIAWTSSGADSTST